MRASSLATTIFWVMSLISFLQGHGPSIGNLVDQPSRSPDVVNLTHHMMGQPKPNLFLQIIWAPGGRGGGDPCARAL